MKANELLFWLSARRGGSWHQFRAAVEELHSADINSTPDEIETGDGDDFPLHQRLRLNLECLAHVEFFAGDCDNGWRVVPPTLAAHPLPENFRSVLCGARSPALLERVRRAAETLECECETLVLDGVPDVIRLVATEASTLSELSNKVGIHFQADSPLAILSQLPPCDPPSRTQRQSEFPNGAGWRIREFDANTLSWRTTDRQHAKSVHIGLFEFQLYDRWEYFLRWAGGTFKLPRAVAVFALLPHRRGILRYDAEGRTLSVPGSCRPPRLLERALSLCSGFPPSFVPMTTRLAYIDVPPEIAHLAAHLLRRSLR